MLSVKCLQVEPRHDTVKAVKVIGSGSENDREVAHGE